MNIQIKAFLSAIAFSLLFYNKNLGLNIFLISMLVVVITSTVKNTRSAPWVYSSAYLLTAFFVFLNPTNFAIFVHFMTFIVFVGKSISNKSSLYITWIMGCINLLIAALVNFTQDSKKSLEKKQKISSKTKTYIQGGIIAAVLFGMFTLLYKNANPVFSELVIQIDLSFISIQWLLFTTMAYFLFLNLLSPMPFLDLIDFDAKQNNTLVKPTEIILLSLKKKLGSEHTLGCMILIVLNLLLAFFLATDGIYLLQETDITNSEYSKSVHQGVYALMFSIVCAIALILYFFRGNLNFFKENKRIKTLTYTWIVLNIILVVFTCFKNYAYVAALGLTYKRIGVFVYLLLTLTGLITACIKVAETKSFVYLVRTNIAVVFSFLVLCAAIPWDKTITKYNINTIKNVDIAYLINLGDSNSTLLHNYIQSNSKHSIDPDQRQSIMEKHANFIREQNEKTWQEYSLYQFVNN